MSRDMSYLILTELRNNNFVRSTRVPQFRGKVKNLGILIENYITNE